VSPSHSALFHALTPPLPRAPVVQASLSATVRIQLVLLPVPLHQAAPRYRETQAVAYQPALCPHRVPAAAFQEVYLSVQTFPRLRHQILPHPPLNHHPHHPHHSLQPHRWHQQRQQRPPPRQQQQQQLQQPAMGATAQ